MPALDRIGLALWTMQSTAAGPGLWRSLYRQFGEDAAVAERLGFHAVWVGEHRLGYDGWVPAPLQALAHAAGCTETIRLGTAMYLAPQHEPVGAARAAATLDRLSGGRLELGLGLGHRDAEFDALGLRRDRRGRLMDEALTAMEAVWAGGSAPRVWIGGVAPAAVARAAARGYSLLLPQTLRPADYRRVAETYREQAAAPGMVGTLRELWLTDDEAAARRYIDRVCLHLTEEAGSAWPFRDGFGFAAREQLARQVQRGCAEVAAGTTEAVAESLRAVLDAGVEYLALRPVFEFVPQAELHEQLHRIATELVPLLGRT